MSITLKRMPFPNPYQYLEVQPGERKLVYEQLMNGGYTGFVRTISQDYYADTFYEWIIDGKASRKIEYTFSITEPRELKPPRIAKKHIRWYFTNNGLVAVVAGVLCDGELVRPA